MKQLHLFLISVLFLFPLFSLQAINLPQVLKGTSLEQEELRAISSANKGNNQDAISVYSKLIKMVQNPTQKARLQQNFLNVYKLEVTRTSNPVPYLEELKEILLTYSKQKSLPAKDPRTLLLNQAITEYKNAVDERITVGLNPATPPNLRKDIIEYVKILIGYKYYSKVKKEYQEKLASLYELNKDLLNAAGTYSILASNYEKTLKKPESKSFYITYISKVIELLQNEINWKNPFLNIGFTGESRSIKGLPKITANLKHPSYSNILKALLSAYSKLNQVKPGFINSFNLALLQYQLDQKDNAYKTIINITSMQDTPYRDFCLDILDIYRQKKEYVYLINFAKHVLNQNKAPDLSQEINKYLQEALPQAALMFIKEKNYTKAFVYFVEFYKTFPTDPATTSMWPQFMQALEGTTDHASHEDWCSYHIKKTSSPESPDYRSERTRALLLSCIKHATDTTYDTNKINFSY